jgi:hypothetical protein
MHASMMVDDNDATRFEYCHLHVNKANSNSLDHVVADTVEAHVREVGMKQE